MNTRSSKMFRQGCRARGKGLAILLSLAFAWAYAPPAAQAISQSCDYFSNEIHITMGDHTDIVRSGSDILVDGGSCSEATPPQVNATSLIAFYDNFGPVTPTQSVTISLAGGPFSPGLDAGPSPEILFTYYATLNWCDEVRIVGSGDADYLRWGGLYGSSQRANFNANEVSEVDADFIVTGGCILFPLVQGGAGDDVLSFAGGADTGVVANYRANLEGGPGADVLVGGTNADTLSGGGGADKLNGGGAIDRSLDGGSGNDTVAGGTGDDKKVLGGIGRDLLLGGPGNDVLNGGPGFDVCKGGPGIDKFVDCEKVVN